jgi:predicted lysophospholipase L1 biosynthesis ABC-type transport system permease subunit
VTILPLAGLVVFTDGRTVTIDEVRTAMAAATPTRRVTIYTQTDITARDHGRIAMQRLVSVALLLTLLIAGCSLAVSVAGGLLERKRPFALLRLAGARPADLNKVALAETAAPLLTAAVISAGLGLAMAALILKSSADKNGQSPWKPPDPLYFAALGGGLLLAVMIATITALPLLAKLTSPETARFE